METVFRPLFDALPEPTLVLSSEGVIIAANKAFARLSGTASGKLHGQPISNLIAMEQSTIDSVIERCSRTSASLPFMLSFRLTHGEISPCQVHGALLPGMPPTNTATLWWRVTPRPSATKSFIRLNEEIDNLKREVLARQKAEAAVRQERVFLQAVVQQIPFGVVIAEAPSGKLIIANAQVDKIWRHAFIPAETVEQYTAYIGFHSNGRAYLPTEWPLARSLALGEVVEDEEIRFLRGDDTYGWMEVNSAPIREVDGSIVAAVVAFTDVTNRKESEQALRASQEQLQQLAAQLEDRVSERTEDLTRAQDRLRALTAELSLAEHRERQRLATELHDYLAQTLVLLKFKLDQAQKVGTLDEHCTSLMAQAQDLLSESLSYTRTLVHDLSPPVLREFGLPSALKWLAERMRSHELEVTLDIPEADLHWLPEHQAVLLFQSVRELLMNIKKHGKCDRGSISLSRDNHTVCVRVQDEGVGFEMGNPASAKPAFGSSKFGLFSIQERMKSLGGAFDITSIPGKGTTATLILPTTTLPIDKEINPAESVPSTSAHSRANMKRSAIHVLLVDDHAMMRQGLRTVLESYTDVEVVGEAANGKEALQAVERLQPTLVIMDINMPIMDGIEAARHIKKQHPDIIVIGLSVNANTDTQAAMSAAGAAMLMTKEAAVEHLYSAMQRQLKSR